MKLIIADTETGGLDAYKHSIVQIGAVVWEAGRIVPDSHFNEIINDEAGELDPVAVEMHGYTRERISTCGYSPSVVFDLWQSYLDRFRVKDELLVLGGHNVGFDSEFLRRFYRLNGYDRAGYEKDFSHRQFDTASVARFLIEVGLIPPQEPKSVSLFAHFGCPPTRAHDALADAEATGRLLTEMCALVRKMAPFGYVPPELSRDGRGGPIKRY